MLDSIACTSAWPRPTEPSRGSAASSPFRCRGHYLLGARLAAGIAHLRGHDVDSEDVRTAVLLCLLGGAASETLKEVGIQVGTKSVASVVKQIPGRTLIEVNKKVGFRLLTKGSTTGVLNLGRMVSLVGAPIGAAVEGLACRAVGAYAKSVFPAVEANSSLP